MEIKIAGKKKRSQKWLDAMRTTRSRKQSPEWIKKRSNKIMGKNGGSWVGDDIGYQGVHSWIQRWKKRPVFCENCGTTIAKKYEWANIDHKYRRVLDDYLNLCTSCHIKYDLEKLNCRRGFQNGHQNYVK